MRKNGREVAAVLTALAVIVAAGELSTTQMAVVCAEEGSGIESITASCTETNDGSGQIGGDNASDSDTSDTGINGDNGQGGANNTTGDSAGDTETGAGASGTDSNTTDGGVDGTGNTEAGAGTDDDTTGGGTGGADGDHATGVGTDTGDTVDTESDDILGDVDEEDEEGIALPAGDMAVFSLRNSRSTEVDLGSFSDATGLNEQLLKYTDSTPVKAALSADIINSNTLIQVNAGNILTLDLAGHTISSSSTVISMQNGGSLTVTGGGKLQTSNGNAVNVTNGNFILESGEVSTGSGNAINVAGGSVEIAGGTVSGIQTAIYMNGGSVEINGGTLTAKLNNPVAQAYAIAVISGELTVSSGTISSEGTSASALFIQGEGKAKIEGGSFSTKVTAEESFGYTCHATGNSELTITGGTFSLDAKAGKSLCIGSSVTADISGGSYSGGGVGIDIGTSSDTLAVGGWANSFYGKLGSGVLSDNTFYKEGSIVYTNASVSVSGGTWNNSCKETRTLTEKTAYSFGSEGWMVEDDVTVYDNCNFYAPGNGTYTFIRK